MSYTIEIRHDGLGKYRVISGTDPDVVRRKAWAQQQTWNEQYRRKSEVMERRRHRLNERQELEDKKDEAAQRTEEARAAFEEIKNLLTHALDIDNTVDWETLKDKTPFPKKQPAPPIYDQFPREPQASDSEFQIKLGLMDKLITSRADKKAHAAQLNYEEKHSAWERDVEKIESANAEIHRIHESRVQEWYCEKLRFEAEQEEANRLIEQRKAAYLSNSQDAITDYCDLVLTASEYPDDFPQDFEIDYNTATKILLVDYWLPSPDQMPRIKEVKYFKTKDDFVETELSESEKNKLYDLALYQICLRTIYELIEADAVSALEAIVFNGWVNSIDRATGKEIKACVLSLQASKKEFSELRLDSIDPKACFKALKGIGSSKLHSITPIAPILTINREDKRFVASYAVAEELNEGFNLAAMDWEDFEHLIRELFAKEFAQAGGEVKVTRASRDGGVDAVVFDPDPIRGGKIVIQAKRYTNTVGVGFVRDLYGTVLNEGATKGILVTTSDYGPDAYEFATGKPLVLLTGGNLLNLLAKHGHKARIDLKEAKAAIHEHK